MPYCSRSFNASKADLSTTNPRDVIWAIKFLGIDHIGKLPDYLP